jgi:aryl-alcohol dehydrogenase-like predicted oxidoreductase
MISRQPFGRTGHQSSRVIFGAAALGSMSQARADQTLELLPEFGVNHIDTAASYGDSELRLRSLLQDHRADYFLATKTGEREGSAARQELERSLDRLGVDQVDLIQLHNLVEPDEFETAHARGGAVDALVRARDEGLVRFIGVTGHGVRIAETHLRSLERFDYDSVLLPYNHLMMQNERYRDRFDELVEVCTGRGVAIQTIKSIARRRWTADSNEPHFAWYEPLAEGPALERAVAYVLSREPLFLNSSSDARKLRPILEAASRELPAPSAEELDVDVAGNDMTPLFDGAELERI